MSRRDPPPLSAVGRSLCQIVAQHPGIHFRGLGRAANVTSAGQLRHHLDRLRNQGLVIEFQDGHYKRYFVRGEHDPGLRPGLARFARTVPRRIAMLLLSGPMSRTELRRHLGCADSTLGYHLRRMVALGDLQKTRGRNCCQYSLTDQEVVRQVLRVQEAQRAMTRPSHPVVEAPRPQPMAQPLPQSLPQALPQALPQPLPALPPSMADEAASGFGEGGRDPVYRAPERERPVTATARPPDAPPAAPDAAPDEGTQPTRITPSRLHAQDDVALP